MTDRPATEVVGTELVRRVAHAGSAKIHALLRHFREQGIDFVPMPLALHGDREELSYLRGHCYMPTEPRPAAAWNAEYLELLGRMLRRCHDASVDFLFAHGTDAWFPHAEECSDPEVICHNDVGPWNVPIEGKTLGMIDWEMAAPGRRIWDVAHVAWNWVPLFAAEERARLGVTEPWSLDERLGRLLTGYGHTGWTRRDILLAVEERQSRVLALSMLGRSGDIMLLSNWANVDESAVVSDYNFVSSVLNDNLR
jgi:hypothetical protein